jgi:Fe-S cluster assembly protein SufD
VSARAAAFAVGHDVPASFVTQFERLERLRGSAPAWLRTIRRDALEHAREAGLPTTRDEEWRFTNIAPIAASNFSCAPPAGVEREWEPPYPMAGESAAELVFLDGRFAPHLSGATGLPRGARAESLADALATDGSVIGPHLARSAGSAVFAALNTSLFEDGALVSLSAGTAVASPISLVFISTLPRQLAMVHPRVLIVAGPGSQARIVEVYASLHPGAGLTNAYTQAVVAEGAAIEHYRLQDESIHAFHIGGVDARIERNGVFASHAFSIGGALVRNDVTAALCGEGGECTLNGLYLAGGNQLVDNHTLIDHAWPGCISHEVYRGILDGASHAVFNGRIIVRQDAQKTDARQTSRALLLSDAAQINAKPQLEIFADDVKCTHGAAVGQLDEEALFYLQARGIGRQAARGMLIRSFAGEIVDRVKVVALRTRLEESISAWLDRSEGARASLENR